jgi:hypothetical protein
VLCALYWLGGGAAANPVRSAYIAALYPKHLGRRLGSAAEPLRHHAERGLAEALGEGRYRITPLGALVVEALPDRAEVGRLRGMRVPAPAPKRLLASDGV